MKFKPVKGMRDFLPDDMAKRNWIFSRLREVYEKYGYGEIQTPAVESLELLTAKGGLGDDAVKDIYRFEDKGGRKIGLRFDPTTPICRIVSANPNLRKPLKWYYITRMWRYEDVSKGRQREFWQGGFELLGPSVPEADAEVLSMTIDCFLALGIKDFALRINDRRVLEGFLEVLGVKKNKLDIFRIIDKLDKVGAAEVSKQLENYLNKKNVGIVLKFISGDLKNARRVLKGNEIGEAGLYNLEKIYSILDEYGIKKYVKIDFSIMRGLDYYTGFIFETLVKGFEGLGSAGSGGRYDKLVEVYGGKSTSATGMGIGIERLVEILEDKKLFPSDLSTVQVYVASVKDQNVFGLCQKLRAKGVNSDTEFMGRSLKKQLEYAASIGAKWVVIVGPDEIKSGKYVLRNMENGKEKKLTLGDIVSEVTR